MNKYLISLKARYLRKRRRIILLEKIQWSMWIRENQNKIRKMFTLINQLLDLIRNERVLKEFEQMVSLESKVKLKL